MFCALWLLLGAPIDSGMLHVVAPSGFSAVVQNDDVVLRKGEAVIVVRLLEGDDVNGPVWAAAQGQSFAGGLQPTQAFTPAAPGSMLVVDVKGTLPDGRSRYGVVVGRPVLDRCVLVMGVTPGAASDPEFDAAVIDLAHQVVVGTTSAAGPATEEEDDGDDDDVADAGPAPKKAAHPKKRHKKKKTPSTSAQPSASPSAPLVASDGKTQKIVVTAAPIIVSVDVDSAFHAVDASGTAFERADGTALIVKPAAGTLATARKTQKATLEAIGDHAWASPAAVGNLKGLSMVACAKRGCALIVIAKPGGSYSAYVDEATAIAASFTVEKAPLSDAAKQAARAVQGRVFRLRDVSLHQPAEGTRSGSSFVATTVVTLCGTSWSGETETWANGMHFVHSKQGRWQVVDDDDGVILVLKGDDGEQRFAVGADGSVDGDTGTRASCP